MSSENDFGVYVKRQQAKLDLTNDAVAVHLGTTGPNFSKWKNENAFTRECIPALAEQLRLSTKTPEEVEAKYEVKWRRPYNRELLAGSSEFKRVLRQIDALHRKAGNIKQLGKLTRELFRYTNKEHFLVSSTSAASLLILKKDNPIGREQQENRFIALDQGLLWALITPDSGYLTKLNNRYTIAFTNSYRTLKAGFDELRADYISHLRNTGIAGNPEEIADMRMQRFEWDEFPFTPPHWTVSLLGECPPDSRKIFRAIVREPYNRTHSYQLFPVGNQPFEYDLLKYFRSIIAKQHEVTLETSSKRDTPMRRRQLFCEALLERMETS